MPSTALTNAQVVPNNAKLIRNALKQVLKDEPKLGDVKGWHNTLLSNKARLKPYGYVKFVQRIPIPKHTDIHSFNYGYQFQVGIIAELIGNEDDIDDLTLDLINLVESSILVNKRLLDTVDLYNYEMTEGEDPDIVKYMPNHRHLWLKVTFTAYVQYDL